MKILIVEDDPSLRDLMQMYLDDYGTCETAGNGEEAFAAFEAALTAGQPYDLICMDIMMPHMDGLEALKKIRRMEFAHHKEGLPAVKVIMITAKDLAKDMLTAYKAGCEAYITKPFSRETLLEQIRELGLLVPSPAESDNENASS